MVNSNLLNQAIVERLTKVIDPETGVDVMRMRLVEDLVVDDEGKVSYTFRPSSPFCPIALPLSDSIQQAIAEVPGVISQDVKVIGFALSDELMAWLKKALEDRQEKQGKNEAPRN
jgi:metal-sulfur cluster biosynthetic enzyme